MRRSDKWPALRRKWLDTHPTCAGCGTTDQLQVHHIVPFHEDKSRELDESNLITLCEKPGHDCHFHFGHFLDWYRANPNVVADAATFLADVEQKTGA